MQEKWKVLTNVGNIAKLPFFVGERDRNGLRSIPAIVVLFISLFLFGGLNK